MSDFEEIFDTADEAIANIIRIQELLTIVDENHDSPKRVKLLVEIYQGWISTEIENLNWSSKRLKKQIAGARKCCKACETQNEGTNPN